MTSTPYTVLTHASVWVQYNLAAGQHNHPIIWLFLSVSVERVHVFCAVFTEHWNIIADIYDIIFGYISYKQIRNVMEYMINVIANSMQCMLNI